MPFFLVTMSHPVGQGWHDHVAAHVEYLRGLVADGRLLASGPLMDRGPRSGALVFEAADREAVRRMVEADPFARAGLVASLSIEAWAPVFGVWAERAGPVPAILSGGVGNS